MKKLYYKTTAAIAVLGLTAVAPASVCMAAKAAIPADNSYIMEDGYDEEILRPGQIPEDVDMTPGEGEAVGVNIDVDIEEASPESDQSVAGTANMSSENRQDNAADTRNGGSQMPSVSKTAGGSSYHIEPAASKDHSVSGSYTVAANLRLRKGAGTTKAIILVMNKNSVVNCYGYYTKADGTKWLLVQYLQDGQKYTGFCSSEYLRRQSVMCIFQLCIGTAYSRANARQYARTYARTPNPNFGYIEKADCTNFVSQIMLAGGKNYSPKWMTANTLGVWHFTKAWANADHFVNRWGLDYTFSDHTSFSKKIKKGDYITYDKNSDGTWDHMGFAINAKDSYDASLGYKDYRVAQHTFYHS